MQLFDALRDLTPISLAFRFLLCILIGGALGLERGRKHRPAGFRTHILVCLGAAMVMMTNQYVYTNMGGDPTRMGAQVVSGIGFLGAGTIMVTGKQQIKGITTAAGIWTAACCGLAIGIGFYEAAILGVVVIMLVMVVFTRLDSYIHRRGRTMELFIEFDQQTRFSQFIDYVRSLDISIYNIQMQKTKYGGEEHFSQIMLTVQHKGVSGEDTLALLSNAPGVHYIEELY